MTAGFVMTMQRRYQLLQQAVTPLLTKAARDLTREEAWLLLEYHHYKNDLKVLSDFAGNQLTLSTSIAGVQFLLALGTGNLFMGSNGAKPEPEFKPNPEFAVVLYRFAVRLKTRWQATHIVWGGVGKGSGKQSTDCHVRGHCLDFYGAHTGRAGLIDVGRDWYHRAVYLPNGNRHPLAQNSNDRWGDDTAPTYRLIVPDNAGSQLDPNDKLYRNDQAKDFFLDVMDFVAEECNKTGDSTAAEMRAGSRIKRGVTMHPDYPDAGLRRGHWDHMHFQLLNAF